VGHTPAPSHATLAGLIVLSLLALAFELQSPRGSLGSAAAAALALSAGSVISLETWALVGIRVALLGVVLLAWSSPSERRWKALAILASGALVVPALLLSAGLATGTAATVASTLSVGVPAEPPVWLLGSSLELTALALALRGDPKGRAVRLALAYAIPTVMLVARARWLVERVAIPINTGWYEGMLLVNEFKLGHGLALYGPPGDVDSYFYSPMLCWVHYGLLKPLGLTMTPMAHRALCILWQLVTVGILTATLLGRRRGEAVPNLPRATIVVGLLLTVTDGFVASIVHPDHAAFMFYALTFALVLREEGWPRWLFWMALATLAPLASLFKLTWAGLGVGLAFGFAIRRRRAPMFVALASVALAVLMAILGGATWPNFRFWVIDLPRWQPFELERLGSILSYPSVWACLAAIAVVARAVEPERRRAMWSALGIVLGTALLTSVAFLKAGGREHNLHPLLVGAAFVLLSSSARLPGRRLLPLALLLLAVHAASVPLRPLEPWMMADLAAEESWATSLVRQDLEQHKKTLLLSHTNPWFNGGHLEIPHDRGPSAAELFAARRPEAQAFFDHVADGRYDTIVARSPLLVAPIAPGGFDAHLQAAVAKKYKREYAGVPPDVYVFRRVE
jgi:hypothetical protein